MKLGEVFRFCNRINENLSQHSNVAKLIATLSDMDAQKQDISDDVYNNIAFALDTSVSYIKELLDNLKFAGISTTENKDVYNYIEKLLKYRGGEYNYLNSFNKLFTTFIKKTKDKDTGEEIIEKVLNREKYGFDLIHDIDVQDYKTFSLIEKAAIVLTGTKKYSTPNTWLASELANIAGKSGGVIRGRLEVLLGLVGKGGSISAKGRQGDVLVCGQNVEVKCTQSRWQTITESGVMWNAARLSNRYITNSPYIEAEEAQENFTRLFNEYYAGLKEYIVQQDHNKIPTTAPDTASIKFRYKSADTNDTVDYFLLQPLNNLIVIGGKEKELRSYIIEKYKEFFVNTFNVNKLGVFEKQLYQIVDKYINPGRTLEDMKADKLIIKPSVYNQDFKYEMGAWYISLYKSVAQFDGILVSVIEGKYGEDEGQTLILKDSSVYLDATICNSNPAKMGKQLQKTDVDFIWPILNNKVSVAMGIVVYPNK